MALDKAILEQTAQFYEAKSKEIMDSTNLIDYLKVADRYRREEESRVEQLLPWDVGQEVLKAFRREMLIKPQAQLLNKAHGFREFLSQQRYEDIELLYRLYREEPDCLKPVGEQMRQFIAEQGKETLRQVELRNAEGKTLGIKEILSTSSIIDKLIKMLDEFLHIVQVCFEANTSFEIQRAQGFEAFVNFEIG